MMVFMLIILQCRQRNHFYESTFEVKSKINLAVGSFVSFVISLSLSLSFLLVDPIQLQVFPKQLYSEAQAGEWEGAVDKTKGKKKKKLNFDRRISLSEWPRGKKIIIIEINNNSLVILWRIKKIIWHDLPHLCCMVRQMAAYV
jgi:hypothetical protein